MNNLRQAALKRGEEPEWAGIAAAATTSAPPCSGHAGALAAYAGMQAEELLVELSAFVKAFAGHGSGPSRALGAEFWQKLVSLKFGPSDCFPYVLHALVCANLISPSNKVIDGICRLIPAAALAQVTSKDARKNVRLAENLMSESRKLVRAMVLSEGSRVRLIGKLDCRLASFLVKKGKDMEARTFDNIEQIGQALHTDSCCSLELPGPLCCHGVASVRAADSIPEADPPQNPGSCQ